MAVFFLAGTFFAAASSFNYFTQSEDYVKWLSPDESANYVFSKLYAQEGDLRIFERYNLYAEDIMHPRSFRSDHGKLKPVSFIGMILVYGRIAAVTGYQAVPYLTPFFAAAGLIFYYLLIKKIFGPRNALISTALLAVFPVYAYYSARSMFHNVFFTVMLVAGLYFAALSAGNSKTKLPVKNWLWAALAGSALGVAAAARASELLWLLPALFILWIFHIRQIGVTRLVIIAAFFVLSLLPVFYWNQILYGSPFYGGYPEMNFSLHSLAQTGTDLAQSTARGDAGRFRELLGQARDLIFHFGFDFRQSAKMFYYYFAVMFPWLFFLAGAGAALYYARYKKIRKKHLAYAAALAALSLILVFYYGSWQFFDNPDPKSFTIGNSYTRYWLPVYLGALPFAAWCIMVVTRRLWPKRLFGKESGPGRWGRPRRDLFIKGARLLAVFAIAAWSLNFVMFGSAEGLYYSAGRQIAAKAERDAVLDLTESNAVIVTQYHDKLFFPERKVIVGLFNDDNMTRLYARLCDYLPVYYYNFTFPARDLNHLNQSRLPLHGLRIEAVRPVTEDFTLYRLYKPSLQAEEDDGVESEKAEFVL